MSEAEYQIERQLNRGLSIGNYGYVNTTVDTRAILNRLTIEEIKRLASEIHAEGLRTEEKFEEMNKRLMCSTFKLSEKQKNALITFIMFAD